MDKRHKGLTTLRGTGQSAADWRFRDTWESAQSAGIVLRDSGTGQHGLFEQSAVEFPTESLEMMYVKESIVSIAFHPSPHPRLQHRIHPANKILRYQIWQAHVEQGLLHDLLQDNNILTITSAKPSWMSRSTKQGSYNAKLTANFFSSRSTNAWQTAAAGTAPVEAACLRIVTAFSIPASVSISTPAVGVITSTDRNPNWNHQR